MARGLADRVKKRRLELDRTQEGLALHAGLKPATYRRFERTGEVSLRRLLGIAFALDTLPKFDTLFSRRKYQSIDDVINSSSISRKRGKKK